MNCLSTLGVVKTRSQTMQTALSVIEAIAPVMFMVFISIPFPASNLGALETPSEGWLSHSYFNQCQPAIQHKALYAEFMFCA